MNQLAEQLQDITNRLAALAPGDPMGTMLVARGVMLATRAAEGGPTTPAGKPSVDVLKAAAAFLRASLPWDPPEEQEEIALQADTLEWMAGNVAKALPRLDA